MARIKLVLLALVIAGLSMGFVACGGDDDEGDTGGGGGGETSLDLTIGDSVPLSGDLADFGPPGQKAADLAKTVIDEAISEAGVDHTVNLVHEDDCGGADQQCAVQAARKMVDSDGASCIAGAWASADTIPTAESVAIPDEVLLISPASTSDEITGLDDNGLVNRTAPPDSFQGPTLADYMDQTLGGAQGKTVNVGDRNDAYGTGLAKTFSDAWESLGGKIGQSVTYDIKLPNYDTEAAQITSGNPDGIVIVDFPETYNKVGPALVRTGNFDTSKAFVTDGLISGDLAESAGEDAVNGLHGTAPGVPDDDTSSKAFDQRYTDFAPKNVDRMTFDAQNFDAVILCYLAAVGAGSTEGADMAGVVQDISAPPGDPFTWQELPEAIKALQNGDDIDYQGASGAIDMDENGDATAGVYDIYEFKNGVPEPVDEVPVAEPGK
jgi:branched-chain amino acid transport system substrate-binding protein